jgi:integrative and conjugative element protein (TIGR02256 family)
MFMSKKNRIVWIPAYVLDEMSHCAMEKFPNETGGVFIGYWNMQLTEAVITNVTGPGPNAVHELSAFTPDSEFQESEIAEYYRRSDGLHTYLGDWHTHPEGDLSLSPTDRRTLRRIGEHKDARLEIPLMGILTGASTGHLKVWHYPPAYFSKLGFRAAAKESVIKVF